MGSFIGIKRYRHIYIYLFNIWDTEWIKAADEAHNTDILRVKMLAEHLQTA